jgi:Flp pilus assembly pilin Flp
LTDDRARRNEGTFLPKNRDGLSFRRGWVAPHHAASPLKRSREMQILIVTLKQFHKSESGQDIMEYAIIVAFAVTVIAVLAALYNTIKSVLTNANSQLQGIK